MDMAFLKMLLDMPQSFPLPARHSRHAVIERVSAVTSLPIARAG